MFSSLSIPCCCGRALYLELILSCAHFVHAFIGGPLPPPHWDLEVHEIHIKIWTRHRTLLETAVRAIRTAPGKNLALILDQIGVDFGPPGAVGDFSRK